MDPASLSLGVTMFFKELYLVSKFVYKAGMSAKYYREELRGLMVEFRHQTLCLRTFWVVIVQSKGKLIPDAQLNQVGPHFGAAVISSSADLDVVLVREH